MKLKLYLFGLVIGSLFLTGCAPSKSFPSGKWIDLTYEFSFETIYWPTSDTFQLKEVFEGTTDNGYYYTANTFCTAEHGGTHIDAPIHFAKGRWTVEQIPLHHLTGKAVVIDVSGNALQNRDYQIGVDDFTNWEATHGRITEGTIVLLKTGLGQFWPDPAKYMGTAKRGQQAVEDLHFPGLHPDAAQWLVDNRLIHAIGLDTPSIDYGQSELYESHQILFDRNIPAFENVANLDRLPPTGAWVIALPIKIKGGSGGPLRIVALLPD